MSIQNLDILDLVLDDVVEPDLPTEGDHTVVVVKAELLMSEKEGKTSIFLKGLVRVTDEQNKKLVEFFTGIPSAQDDKDVVNSKKLALKRLYDSCQIIYSGSIRPADLVGAVGFCRIKTQKDEEYGDKSIVKSWLKR